MINKHDISGPEIVTGSQHCKSSTLYFPHCAELNTNYTDVVSRKKPVFLTNLNKKYGSSVGCDVDFTSLGYKN